MQEVPKWVYKLIDVEDLKCRQCKKEFKSDNLMSISIQESSQPPHKDFLCIGLFCPNCKELMIFELKEMSLVDFAFDIVDQETSNNIKKTKNDKPAFSKKSSKSCKKRNKSKITIKEVNEMKKFLKQDLTHDQFLIAMGMSPSDIESYNYKKDKKDKKDKKEKKNGK
jgi:hypothetical protein